jgi:hypothetical protein
MSSSAKEEEKPHDDGHEPVIGEDANDEVRSHDPPSVVSPAMIDTGCTG